jgi:hypothetical protein
MDNGNTATNSNTYLEVFNASSCASISTSTSYGCSSVASSLNIALAGGTYYFRVFTTTGTGGNSGKYGFSVCVSYTTPPSNDDCTGAITLTSGTTNSSGTVWLATATSGIPVGCATGNPDDDVWYKLTTSIFDTSLTVSLTAIGSNLSTSGTRIQVFTGNCGSLASYACGTTSLTISISGNTTYYIRIYSAGTGSIGGSSSGSAFSISIQTINPFRLQCFKLSLGDHLWSG